ncbi:cyclase family protein [Chondrinema litorale]|uniref:cyclase family protein n=1 Tax=Chondrinema litorale TaxID=2994555 RepID=UPI0025427B85|nr:cyclase family protein [Chondrinema litorale]UZR95978.1 cyclase family protein [Chondrinema litorale]
MAATAVVQYQKDTLKFGIYDPIGKGNSTEIQFKKSGLSKCVPNLVATPPIHFSKTGESVDEIPLENLFGTAINIDISSNALSNPDYLVSVDDFLNWEKNEQTKLPDGCIVLLQTGYSQYYPDKIKYLGTDKRGTEAVQSLHFPGLSPEAAKWLVENRNIKAIGIDTPSIDFGQSEYFESHVILLSKNIPVFENLTMLNQLPSSGFEIIALPMKIKGGSGAPLRVVAIFGS